MARRSDGYVPSLSLLLHPLPLAAIALTAVNDHLLKGCGALPGWLTGKLSDFAGLFFFPIAVVAVWRAIARGRWPRVDAAMPAIAAAMTGAFMALFKLSPRACAWLPVVVVPDASDLLALPVLPLACWWIAARDRAAPACAARWARLAALGAAALTSAATSRPLSPMYYRPLPIWSVVPPAPGALACARPELWVSKSGREGVGLTLALRAPQAACTVRIDRVTFVLPGAGVFVAAGFPEEVIVPPGQVIHRYVPIAFDNDVAWRRRRVSASVELRATDSSGAQALRFDLVQRLPAAPRWAVGRGGGRQVGSELLVTETGRDGVRFVVRLWSDPASPRRVHLGSLRLFHNGTWTESAPEVLIAELAGSETVDVPFFIPVDAERGPLGADAKVTIELMGEGGDAHVAEWEISAPLEWGHL